MLDPSKLSFAVPAFNSYKEYSRSTAALTVTGTVLSGQIATFSSPVSFAHGNSVAFIEFTTNVTSDNYNPSNTYILLPNTLIHHSDGSTPTLPGTANYDIQFQNSFSNDSVIVTVTVFNPNADTLTVVNETLAVGLYAVIAPFKA